MPTKSEKSIFRKRNKTFFVKTYKKDYPDKLLISEFEKAKKVYALLKKGRVKTPEPLTIDIKNKQITFRGISDFMELKSFYFKNSNLFYKNEYKIEKTLKFLAQTLASLHNNLKLKKSHLIKCNNINDSKPVFILGDVCNSNILVTNKNLYLIDFTPADWLFDKWYEGDIKTSGYIELAQLILTFYFPPLYQRLLLRINRKYLEEVIIKAYFRERNIKLNKKNLIEAKKYVINRWLKQPIGNKLLGLLWRKIYLRELRKLENEI